MSILMSPTSLILVKCVVEDLYLAGEELLPEAGPEDEFQSNKVSANDDIISQLVSMGFNHLHCQKAAINTSNAGVEEAVNWLLSHMDDPNINNDPISHEADLVVDQSKVDMLLQFGFQEGVARKALVEVCVIYLGN